MDKVQRAIFGPFPRAVGTNQANGQIRQWVVHTEGEFDVFFDTINGVKNAYASLSHRPVGGNLKLDKVSIDFDTPQKDEEDGWPVFGGETPPQDEIIARMRNDEYIADEVLAPVIDDAQSLVERSLEEEIPVLCVFSGLGIHVHQFYKEKVHPDKQIDTTAKKYVRDMNLATADMGPIGDVKRIMRIPNAHRVHLEMQDGAMIGSRPTGVMTIPVLPEELIEMSASELLELATNPRLPDISYLQGDRPEMKTYDDYLDSGGDPEDISQEEMRRMEQPVNEDEFLEYLLKDYLTMPCMYERIQQPEPNHAIRRNCAVLMYNLGLTPGEVVDIFSRIGWRDWDRGVTREQLDQIYRTGYADMSCHRLREDGFCVRADRPTDCETFGWSGGQSEWK